VSTEKDKLPFDRKASFLQLVSCHETSVSRMKLIRMDIDFRIDIGCVKVTKSRFEYFNSKKLDF
jgi:hypothetical protein